MCAPRLVGGRGLYIDGGRDSSPKLWTWFIEEPSLDAILLFHIMITAKSTMNAVPPIFDSGHDSYSNNTLGRGFSSDDIGRVYS